MLQAFAVGAMVTLSSAGAPQSFEVGRLIERVACASDPTQTYTLYLPSTYAGTRKWPLLFIFDPRGRGTLAAKIFQDAAEQFGWIIASSDNTRSDGPWEPNQRAVAAMWPDVLSRFPIDERRIYAAGFSGGASVAWALGRESQRLAGIIAAGAPEVGKESRKALPFAWFGAAGRRDFNHIHAQPIAARVARGGRPARVEYFDGAHEWLPPSVALRAVGWLEALAMRGGLAQPDAARAARIRDADLTAAGELEKAGRLVEARRLYEAIERSLDGLVAVGAATERIRALANDPQLAKGLRDEARAIRAEQSYLRDLGSGLSRLYGNEPPMLPELRSALDLERLQKLSREPGAEGEAAQRALEMLFVQTSFYLWRQFEEQREFLRAALCLEIAAAIHPDRPRIWYDLAAARAMSGSKSLAINALDRAIETGFTGRDRLERDQRFSALRDTPEFGSLLQRIK